MKNCSIFFLLIILLAATLVQCHYEHWYQHFNKDSTTSTTTAKILAADAKAEASGGNVKNSNSFPDDDFDDRIERSTRLAAGVIVGIVIASIVVCCGLCYCFIRLCNVMCCNEQRGHVVVMNNPVRQAPPPAPQIIVQQVPYQPGSYPSQQNLNYAGQMNVQTHHAPPEAMQQQQQYSPYNPNQQSMAPPPYGKF